MRVFLIVFFLIYGSMHLYAFMKAKAALRFGVLPGALLLLFMAIMTAAPVIVRYLERGHLESAARVTSYTGYIWMGLLVLFIFPALCIDLSRFLLSVIRIVAKTDVPAFSLTPGHAFFIPLFFALIAGGYGYFEARDIHVERLTIRTPKIPADSSGLRIVQISDVHIGLIVRKERLKTILEKVKEAAPDVLVSTGDLVDGQINRLEGIAEMFHEIRPRYGKFAVTGNHEYYAGLDQALAFTEKAGFTILRGEAADIAGLITLAGVDDSTGRQFGRFNGGPEEELLAGLDQSKFTVLMKHRPLVEGRSPGLFDLQISGHTHKGQIFPFSLVTKFYYPRHAGVLALEKSSKLYVSRGSGTLGPSHPLSLPAGNHGY